MGSSKPVDISTLLQSAEEDQSLSLDTLALIDAGDLGQTIQNNLGVTVDNLFATSSTIVLRIIDNSGSIDAIRAPVGGLDGPHAVCEGANIYLEAFAGAKESEGIIIGTWLVNQELPVQAPVPVVNAIKLEVGKNYTASGMTPLYRQLCAVLATAAVKIHVEYANAGVPARAILLVVTDGKDEDSYMGKKKYGPQDVRKLIEELGENIIVQFMGIEGTLSEIEFRKIAEEMGIQPQHIVTAKSTPHDIRAKLQMTSLSARTASKSSTQFSHVAAGGFTTKTP